MHLHAGVSMSTSVMAHGAEHRWQHLSGKVTLAGTGARVVGTGRGRWDGAGLRALLSWAHRIQHIPAALEGPSSRHHLRDSHVTPASNHQDSCSSCEVTEILTPGGTSQLSSVTETATFRRGSWGTWVSKEGFCEEATPSPPLGISLVDQRHQLCLHTLPVLALSPVLTVAKDGEKLPMADGQAGVSGVTKGPNELKVADLGTPLSRMEVSVRGGSARPRAQGRPVVGAGSGGGGGRLSFSVCLMPVYPLEHSPPETRFFNPSAWT